MACLGNQVMPIKSQRRDNTAAASLLPCYPYLLQGRKHKNELMGRLRRPINSFFFPAVPRPIRATIQLCYLTRELVSSPQGGQDPTVVFPLKEEMDQGTGSQGQDVVFGQGQTEA